MTNIEKFNETVSILVKAYLNDELKHDDCKACVVGNICEGETIWKMLFMTTRDGQISYIDLCPEIYHLGIFCQYGVKDRQELLEKANIVCQSTGYTVDELKRIEYTFETCNKGSSDDEHMFNGLMAVVDVLADIHKIDLSVKEQAKQLFVK